MQSLYFLIPTLVIILLMLPIILEVRFSYNLFENKGTICIYLFKIKLQYFLFEICDNQIKIQDQKQTSEKQIDFDSPELAFYEEFVAQIKDKTRLKFLELYYNIGLDDAFLTSMVCGLINVCALILFTGMKNKKPTASLGVYDIVSYNKKVVEFAIDLSVSISLFDVVYSFINSVILSRKKSRRKEDMESIMS